MALPTWVGSGALVVGTNAVTPALPASLQVGDRLYLCGRTNSGQAMTIPTPNGGTWTEIADSPQDESTSGLRATVFESVYNGTQGDPTTNDSGTINMARIIAIRGGGGINVTAGGVQTATTSASAPGDTTTVDDCLIIIISTCDRDASSTTNASGVTNADLANLTERIDEITASGAGGGHAIFTGEKATAGAFGATTWTQAASGGLAHIVIAVAPNNDRMFQLSFAEFETPDAPRQYRLSLAEFETGDAPRQYRLSHAELETPDAPATDRQYRLSHAEFETPDAPRQYRLSFAEFEIPNADRKFQLSFAEFEVPDAPGGGGEPQFQRAGYPGVQAPY